MDITTIKKKEVWNPQKQLPGIHLRRFNTDDGRLRSAKNLYKSSSFSLSVSWREREGSLNFYG